MYNKVLNYDKPNQWIFLENKLPGIYELFLQLKEEFLLNYLILKIKRTGKKKINISINNQKLLDLHYYNSLNAFKVNTLQEDNSIETIKELELILRSEYVKIEKYIEEYRDDILPNLRYLRKSIHTIDEILDNTIVNGIKNKEDLVNFDGDMIHMASDRYKTFKLKGIKCVCCGIEGKYFAKETTNRNITEKTRFHFNLYANENGKEILMTKDHIIPKSKGGKNHIDNYQPMCVICNNRKGNKIIESQNETCLICV